jgi:hypothetical protein
VWSWCLAIRFDIDHCAGIRVMFNRLQFDVPLIEESRREFPEFFYAFGAIRSLGGSGAVALWEM